MAGLVDGVYKKDKPKKNKQGAKREETRVNEWTRRTEPFSELSSQVAVSIKKKGPQPWWQRWRCR